MKKKVEVTLQGRRYVARATENVTEVYIHIYGYRVGDMTSSTKKHVLEKLKADASKRIIFASAAVYEREQAKEKGEGVVMDDAIKTLTNHVSGIEALRDDELEATISKIEDYAKTVQHNTDEILYGVLVGLLGIIRAA